MTFVKKKKLVAVAERSAELSARNNSQDASGAPLRCRL